MKYYRSNAVYDRLANTPNPPFLWISGDAWFLVYGDGMGNPRLLAFVATQHYRYDKRLILLAQSVSRLSHLPLVYIQFDGNAAAINEVRFAQYQVDVAAQFENVNVATLKDKFKQFGLPVQEGVCQKAINDKSSSAYHHWQRCALGRNMVVSDVDLIRFTENNGMIHATEIVELKRAYIALDKWSPYPDDYPNFDLIAKLCEKLGIKMRIAYNVRTKFPFCDDCRRLSLFEYDYRNTPKVRKINTVDFDAFVAGEVD